ncbi:MAG: S8 family serine peptidase [Bdellovibrionales bacterium]|nr:S8 family serine peptidase [Bdellovibrionales bacterium]
MKKILVNISLVSMGMVLLGCGPRFQSREVQRAPASKNELGVVAQGISLSERDTVLKNSNAKFRTVNSKHGLYEFYNVSETELKTLLPQAKIYSNQFFEFQPMVQKLKTDFKMLETHVLKQSSENETDQRLNPCVRDARMPSNILKLQREGSQDYEPVGDLLLVERGETLHFMGSDSAPHKDVGGSLKFGFAYVPPEGSLQKETIVFSDELTFAPDAYGPYGLILVVQDKNDVCSMKQVMVGVTGNKPMEDVFEGPAQNLSDFTHLKELNAAEAWEKSTGENVTVAIIDTGVNYNHPDLSPNIFINESEVPGNGIDDDGNGYVDDAYGYDFINNDPFPYDDVGHGSHVSGLTAAASFGMAKNAKILPVKVLGAIGGDLASIVGGVHYAVDSGAQILNMSLGNYFETPAPEIVESIEYAESKGVLVVAASGNGHPTLGIGLNTDRIPNYPSALPNENILSVAAKDSFNALASYSNYGKDTVDLTAPGGGGENDPIMSSFLDNPAELLYLGMSGTSMATPIVSGIAAQVWSLNPTLSALEVKEILMNSGEEVADIKDKTVSGRTINALSAVNYTLQNLP